ncbi:MAG: 6,7-dimethyl-8-ribityllumazine synthase [Candidatus Peribacteraceae bacterium]|nr:6,7-dimethyl-8-ribityllumazine synthase [Candidatus Peribacteraceae bacterium]
MKPGSYPPFDGAVNTGWRVGIIHASYYKEEIEALVAGAERALLAHGLLRSHVKRYPVYGSFEIPLVGAALAREKQVDALIGIGIIVEGETHHARLLAEQATRGMMDVQLQYGVPFAFEVLYVDDIAHVRTRLDKGEEAALAVLQSLASLERIRA